MPNYPVRGYKNIFLAIGFILMLSGAIVLTGALLAGQGLSGGFLAILGEILLLAAGLNIFLSYYFKY